MSFAQGALLVSGGLILAGISYPDYARRQPGWKVGAWAGGVGWALWYALGALAYFGGMGRMLGWLGLLAAVPLAFIVGFGLTTFAKRHTQLIALIGPILANLWFVL